MDLSITHQLFDSYDENTPRALWKSIVTCYDTEHADSLQFVREASLWIYGKLSAVVEGCNLKAT